ncbi:MAG: hypothetical protein HRU39_08500, partial [Salinicola sp.]|nr:hypothetical protein [Salinicola sp.]
MSQESEPTRKALYERARQQEIAGRSKMSKAELAAALERQSFEEAAAPVVATRF